ncbi:MAG: hypothetical protein AVDCRST_MAG88-3289 [uncultured Thermomicrobiales bacterium]|uniref:Uncharacterized protein n=1 Tax=uncultured Thermomicrobiales bacterium TaxID=1645740 RepID=A0A6J4VNJ2_9BACT|nr:MAG: hypothetical protein AVDCRST_MAG88-3289 [uncultured Thermomicrobiales bacterium]
MASRHHDDDRVVYTSRAVVSGERIVVEGVTWPAPRHVRRPTGGHDAPSASLPR